MSDPEVVEAVEIPEDDAAIAAEVDAITKSPAEQQGDKVKGALIAAKKGEKALRKEVEALKPVAARAAEIEQQLATAQPVINAILSNPRLRAEALKIASGTSTSHATTEQPEADADAVGYAEDMGWYLSDNVTVDAARGRRVLDRVAKVSRGQAEDVVRPFAGVTLSTRAEANIARAIAETDDEGTPLATEESIREVAAQLPPQLLADPKVSDLVLNSAIGIDRRKRRTPKAPADPLYLAPNSSRRTGPAYSTEDKRAFASAGLTEADLKKTLDKLDKAGGKAVNLGS